MAVWLRNVQPQRSYANPRWVASPVPAEESRLTEIDLEVDRRSPASARGAMSLRTDPCPFRTLARGPITEFAISWKLVTGAESPFHAMIVPWWSTLHDVTSANFRGNFHAGLNICAPQVSQTRRRQVRWLQEAPLTRPPQDRCRTGNGDLRAVQDFLGHADPRMTAKYAHVVDMAKKNPALFIPAKVG